jgi:phosphoglycerate dehydrogenase-like enzyme
MELLIHEESWRRLATRIREIAPDLRVDVMDAQGNISVDGVPTPVENVGATIGWANTEVFAWEARREYFRALLKIPTMQWVQSAAAGVDDPVFARLVAKGVTLTNSDAQGPAIADFILGAALDYYQRQDERRRLQEAREWQKVPFRELSETNWLIIGYGHIGRETARRAHAFGCSVTGIRRRPQADEFAGAVVTIDQLSALLPRADVVVLSIGLNEGTRNLASTEFFRQMKRDSLFVNVGRGGLVDESALLHALEHNAPARAVLDVFNTEPLPADSVLWTHPKIRVSAHTSNLGSGNALRNDELFLDNLGRHVRGEPLRNVVREDDLT